MGGGGGSWEGGGISGGRGGRESSITNILFSTYLLNTSLDIWRFLVVII